MVSRGGRSANGELVARCLEGDELAWRELVGRYERLIYAVPRRIGLSTDDAADVFQSVCVALYRNLGSIRDPERLAAWLVVAARRESWLVSARNRLSVSLETDDSAAAYGSAARLEPVDDVWTDVARAQIVREAIEDLPDRCRSLIGEFLREDAPTDYTEVARRLGVPRGSLGPTRARCLEHLRRILKRKGFAVTR